MIKLIHCADIHLESALTAHLDDAQARERNSEILTTFSKMVEYASENGVSGILIAGDMFDKSVVSAKTRKFILDIINRYHSIIFYYLRGNHDIDGFLEKIGECPDNFKPFSKQWSSYTHPDESRGRRVVITGVELLEENEENIYSSLKLKEEDINIVMLHGQDMVYETHGRDQGRMITLPLLRGKNIDYLALGHIHAYRENRLDSRGVYAYSGCLEGRGFDECGKHGFVLLNIDTEEAVVNTVFIPFAGREIHRIEVDGTGCTGSFELLEQVKRELADKGIESKDLINVLLTGFVPFDSEIDMGLIKKQLEGQFYAVRVENRLKLEIDYKQYEQDKSLKGEFVRKVWERKDLSEDEKKKIIRYGIQALSNQEID